MFRALEMNQSPSRNALENLVCEANSSTVRQEVKFRKIHRWKGFYVIPDGSFGLVWPNILVYILSHVVYLCGWYHMILRWNDQDYQRFFLFGMWENISIGR